MATSAPTAIAVSPSSISAALIPWAGGERPDVRRLAPGELSVTMVERLLASEEHRPQRAGKKRRGQLTGQCLEIHRAPFMSAWYDSTRMDNRLRKINYWSGYSSACRSTTVRIHATEFVSFVTRVQ